MATTNTYSFTVSASDIVNAALRSLQVLDSQSVANSTDLTNGIQALNLLLKSLATRSLPIWLVEWVIVPMVAGKNYYSLGPTGDVSLSYRPSRIISAFLRNVSQVTDTTLQIISRQEAEQLGSKLSQGIVNQIYLDNQLPLPILYVYDVPVDTSTNIWLSVQRPIMDLTNSTDNFDVPQEWFMLLKWLLAEELALEYSVPSEVLQMVVAKSKMYLDLALGMSQEEASVYFSVDPQTYYYNRST